MNPYGYQAARPTDYNEMVNLVVVKISLESMDEFIKQILDALYLFS